MKNSSIHFNPGTRKIRYAMLVAFVALFAGISRAQLLIPYAGSNTLTCGTNTIVQDHSGFTGYSTNANGYVVIQTGQSASVVITATYITESGYDYVRIYNGTGTGGTLLNSYSGTGNFTFTGTPGQTVTVSFTSDGSINYTGANMNVVFAGNCYSTACSGTPAVNAVTPGQFTTCPNLVNPGFTLGTYTLNSIAYQWQSSTVSPVGPFTPVANATNVTLPPFTTSVTTWYQVVVTCTNGGASTPINVGPVNVVAVTTDTAPYFEGFENIPFNNRLPNCSWSVTSTSVCQTYTSSNTLNRVPRTGNSFASFYYTPAGTNYYYTNSIMLQPGITYSAGFWYQTDLTGAANWSNLAILVGTAQTSSNLTQIAGVNGPAISSTYKLLSGTFTVPTAGYYNIAIRATSSSGAAQYLSWDDLFINIPCSLNSPSVTVATNTNNICQGSAVVLTASGANSYMWTSGQTANVITDYPVGSTVYQVTGTSSVSGCAATASVYVNVKPSPVVNAIALNPSVCSGSVATLMASGAGNYLWNTTQTGAVINVTPTAPTSYTVVGTATNNCTGKSVVNVNVNPVPSVSIFPSANSICANETVTLNATGGSSYMWYASTGQVYQGTPQNRQLTQPTTFTLVGTDANGCQGTAIFPVGVDLCLGIAQQSGSRSFRAYPNPVHDQLNIVSDGSVIRSIQVMDISGRAVMNLNDGGSSTQTVDVASLPAGVYFVKVTGDSGTDTIRIIRQ